MGRLERLGGRVGRKVLRSGSPSHTIAIGKTIGLLVPQGSVIALEGGLGAGKTLLAKGICAGLGVDEEVLSPSFVLVEEYRGELPVLHFDLYRLERFGETEEIGLFDAIDGHNVVIVEWGDRLPEGTLDADMRVSVRFAGEREREITIEAPHGLFEAMEGVKD